MDRGEEAAQARTEDVADIDSGLTDDEAQVDEDGGDNDARKDAFDAIVADTDTCEL